MRPYRLTLLPVAVVLTLLIALVVPFATRDAEAAPLGLKLPALAGTQWKAASGYNTATHLGVDPYALDLGGGGASQDCAWIRASEMTVLICHIITESYARNASIIQGQLLGTVAPEGQKGNNGLAHIHLAVNLGGSSGTSLPFDGDYTLDGVRFPATTEANAYSGAPIVTSTNTAIAGAPAAATPMPRATSPPPESRRRRRPRCRPSRLRPHEGESCQAWCRRRASAW
ncbi:MAG: hypothetical protein EXR66_09745 [Dehalococcoidia bacterium]|nr:hypothetical protein [Dehalococcoidia bacterium]